MGIEVYGLLGVFISLAAAIALLDMGISTTLNRELSKLTALDNSVEESRHLAKTFEIVYWVIGCLAGCLIFLLAPLIAKYWINSSNQDISLITQALMIMGLMVAVQWPGGLYAAALMGLHRQVELNIARTVTVTLQHLGAVLILYFYSRSILVFFAWQSFVGLLTSIIFAILMWRTLKKNKTSARFKKEYLFKNLSFASGVTGISLVTILLTHLDKVLLSKLISLESFGYYMVAFTIASALNIIVSPLHLTFFPKFTQLIAAGSENSLIPLYHKGTKLAAALTFPIAINLIFFSKEILTIWLNNQIIPSIIQPILILLVIGTAMNNMMMMPYTLQLSNGWTRFTIYTNTFAVILLVPLMILLVERYQGMGAALVWLILNMGYLIIQVPVMHMFLLKGEMVSWYLHDLLYPFIAVCLVVLPSFFFMPADLPKIGIILWIAFTFSASLIASLWNTGYVSVGKIKDTFT